MDSTVIHETIIRDILDVIDDVKDIDFITNQTKTNRSFRSIAQASSNLTLVFPVITSKNISIDNAAMIAKAIERKAVTMLQMLFAAVNISNSDNGMDYVKTFHTNLRIDDKITVDGFIDAMDSWIANNESALIIDRPMYEKVKNDLKNINYFLPESISENSLNDFYYDPRGNFGRGVVLQEAKKKEDSEHTENIERFYRVYDSEEDMEEEERMVKNLVKGAISNTRASANSKNAKAAKDAHDILRTQLIDSDVKKANELIPTMMIVNFVKTGEDKEPIYSNLVIGVKAKLYPVDSTDLMNRIVIKNEDRNGFLKLVKSTTREISFFRDFLFMIDRAKVDALSHSRRGSSSKLWKILERRALKSKVRRRLNNVNDATAISTLVMSNEEVEFLKKTEGINVMEPRVIRPIMESYNLMGVCVVDESVEAAHFIFDTGSDIYETVPFTHLEREASDNSYKKVVNLMNKINR